MKKIICRLSISLLALAASAAEENSPNVKSGSPPAAPSNSRPALASLPWRAPPRMAFDDSLRAQGSVQTYNWSGLAATGATGAFASVTGTWTVNAVTGSSGEYAAVWVGLDGFDDSTVEQTGTLAYITTSGSGRKAKTVVDYYAWVEMYPAGMVEIPETVEPGDIITATVNYNGGVSYTVYMTDERAGAQAWSFSQSYTGSSSAEQNSAEWVVEAPASCSPFNCEILPLADFGTETFAGCTANGEAISAFSYDSMTMVSERGDRVMAAPSTLAPRGSAFSDTWASSGP